MPRSIELRYPGEPLTGGIIIETRAGHFFNDPTRQRCQEVLSTLDTAPLMPSWLSEETNFTPLRRKRPVTRALGFSPVG
jgi:hypothetical protein